MVTFIRYENATKKAEVERVTLNLWRVTMFNYRQLKNGGEWTFNNVVEVNHMASAQGTAREWVTP